MSRYAKIINNIVVNTIECEDNRISELEGTFIKCTTDTKNCSIGQSYDETNNKFINEKPYESWVLNTEFEWESPKGANPNILTKIWDEETQDWVNRA